MPRTRNRGQAPFSLLGFLFVLLFAAPVQAQDNAAGTIDFADGDATVEGQGVARLAKEGDAVKVGETVTTFPKAEVHLRMADGAYLSVRENTKITISKYRANGDDADESLIDLARGALRSVTGWIGKYRRAGYQVRTPMVTIGVRGTDHETTHLLEGDPRGEPGTYDKVNEGATVMRSPKGTVEVQPNRAGYFNATRSQAPRVLAEVPRFFQPARNEARFAQRAQASVRTVDERRNERRRARGLAPQKPPAAQRSPAARQQDKAAQRFQERAAQRNEKSPAARMQDRKAEVQRKAQERRMEPRRFEKPAAQQPHPQQRQFQQPHFQKKDERRK